MDEDVTQASTKRRIGRSTIKQNSTKAMALPRPSYDDKEAWKAYWEKQVQAWRTEPEINAERQKYLDERRSITPDIEQGIYPFKNIQLSRADVEWLLATHEGGQGPAIQMIAAHARGLDLRGADLRDVNLSRLPLAQLRGGLGSAEWRSGTKEQREAAAVHLEEADLNRADLTWASLRSAHLEGVNLKYARLEGATLRATKLGGKLAFLPADLRRVSFNHETNLEDIVLGDDEFGFVRLADVHWGDVNLSVIDWAQVNVLGDEREARQWKKNKGKRTKQKMVIDKEAFNDVYWTAIRANRQLAITYLLVVGLFAVAYFVLGFTSSGLHHLEWYEALVVSLTAFHGRGFFSDQFQPGDPQAFIAAVEAVIGLLIEISFIATFTQRFFGK